MKRTVLRRPFCPSVCLSVCLSNVCFVTRRNKLLPKFLYHGFFTTAKLLVWCCRRDKVNARVCNPVRLINANRRKVSINPRPLSQSTWDVSLPVGSYTPYIAIKANSPFHPSGVGKWVPASAGKAKAGMVHSVSGCTRGVQVKLWDPLRTRAIPERLRGVITTRRYTNPHLPYLTLP